MVPVKKSLAPSLENGLNILELLNKSPEGLNFAEIQRRVDTSKSTLIRLLKVLVSKNYILRNKDGKYQRDYNMSIIGASTQIDILRYHVHPVLESFADQLDQGNTVVLIGSTEREMIVLDMIQREGSIYMQAPGTVRDDFSYAPWAWIFYSHMTASQRDAIKSKITVSDFDKKFPEWEKFYRENNYCFDSEFVFEHIRRIAAPVFNNNGKAIAAIAIGGNKLSMPDKNIDEIGKKLIAATEQLSSVINR